MKHKTLSRFSFRTLTVAFSLTFLFSVQLVSCASPQESVFEGQYSTSFETSIFYPCDLRSHTKYQEEADYIGHGTWLISDPNSGFNEKLKTFETLREPTGALKVYVKFAGVQFPTREKGYGHLNMYSDQVSISEILEVKPWNENLCQVE